MVNIPVRELGLKGVVTDRAAPDLPLGVFAEARNVSFNGSGVSRSPVFKPPVLSVSHTAYPVLATDDSESRSNKSVTVLYQDGAMKRIKAGAVHDVSPATKHPVVGVPIATRVGNVSYVNTQSGPPLSLAGAESRYSVIPGWQTNESTAALRHYRDFLVALNVTKTATAYPSMVKWSDAIQSGVRPRWDTAETNSLAGETVLNCDGQLVDGLTLGDHFIIYGTNEVWRMGYVGGSFVFTFERLFSDLPIMSQNCVAEVQHYHYVFGESDIIKTDGVSYESVAAGRIRHRVFSRVDYNQRHLCRVFSNPSQSEVIFAYPTATDAAFDHDGRGCNEAAVYNYESDTWSFIDLPNVTSGASVSHPEGVSDKAVTWDGLANWNQLSQRWNFASNVASSLMLTAAGDSAKTGRGVFFYDPENGGAVSNDADQALIWPASCSLLMADFDELGVALHDTKLLRSLVLQIANPDALGAVGVQTTAQALPALPAEWGPVSSFDPVATSRLNFRTNGRYVSIRFTFPEGSSCRLSGFDVDLVVLARR
ncbi:hypothetical protein [Paracoccus sp. (in: a-proteobacteria)]|uniref:hypothetical protein n=1 Tax=Paracoccus sp. TaxID=267 RepID=UPI0026E0B5A2|nr:hypothetical protein [Paracoccus sp. (in: a-proteobacteria)]MDO5647377.1 hypothetical protein [Paracoccus sp. (in: a-proteobacteria)]